MTSFKTIVLAGALAMAACSAQAADLFTLSSPAIKDGAVMAQKFAGNFKGNPNCVGEGVSPALAWSNAPAGTKSFALLVVDPQGRNGLGVDHFVAYGIPASVSGFAEGELSAPSDKFVGGKGTAGSMVYFGPCPPVGMAHHYNFTLIATDLDPKELAAGLTSAELFARLNGHGKDATGFVGLFAHP